MAIVFESYSVDYCADSSDTTLSSAVPSGTQDGDLLIAIATHVYVNTITPPSGWTSIFEYKNSSAYVGLSCFYKIASGESGSYSFSTRETSSNAQVVICRISGASSDAPTGSAQGDGTWDNSITCPDQSVTVADSMILWIGSTSNTAHTFTSNRGDEQYDDTNGYAYPMSVYSEIISSTGTQTGAVITTSASKNLKSGGGIVIATAASSGPSLAAAAYYYQRMIAG